MSNHELYLNLPVADLDRSKAFFEGLGFRFDPRFTNADGACLVLSDRGYVMLLTRAFFKTFTPREVGDPAASLQALFAFSLDSRAAVDALVDRAIALGGTEARETTDHGYMYARSFFDLDGHQWEPLWMDMSGFIEAGSNP